MKTLIIGANGNLGRKVAKAVGANSTVKAGIRKEANFLNEDNIENVVFDYDRPETFHVALDGVDAVFVQAPPLDAAAFERISPFIDVLAEKGIKRVVFNSAWGVDHNEEAPLRKLERKFMNEDFAYTFVRPNFFIENFTSGFASEPLHNDGVIVHNAGDSKITFVSIDDIADVVAQSLQGEQHVGKAYNLAGSEAWSHQEVADFFAKKMNKEVQNVLLTSEQMKAGAIENGLPESVADYLVMLYDIAAEGHMAHPSNDIQDVLGRAPKTFNDVV